MRNRIMQSSILWKRQFELFYPNLVELMNDWIQLKLWNDQRSERLQRLLLVSAKTQVSSNYYTNVGRDFNQDDVILFETKGRDQLVEMISAFVINHAFYETNFNSEYNWNRNFISDFKFHRVSYSIYFEMMKFFYLLIETKQLNYYYDISLLKITNQVTPKNGKKLFKELLTDLIFKSNFPSSLFNHVTKKEGEEADNEEKLPSIYFENQFGWGNAFIRINPKVVKFQSSNKIEQLECDIEICAPESQFYTFNYPQDFEKILNLAEKFVIFLGKYEISYEKKLGHAFGFNKLENSTVEILNFKRIKCVNQSASLRVYFQSQVDKYSKLIVKNYQAQANHGIVCNNLAQYPSKSEIHHLLINEDLKFLDLLFNEERSKLFIEKSRQVAKTYDGKGFKVENLLIRAVDKCMRRYLHLYLFAQPSLIFTTSSCTILSRK